MNDIYHLVLLGTRLPQLALGALMARWGQKVLIIDQHKEENSTNAKRKQGYIFRKRPAPLFGLDSAGLLRQFLDEIGIGRVLVQRSYPRNPASYQVVLPRSRINVTTNREHLLDELFREFPERIDTFRNLYSEWDLLARNWYDSYPDLDSFIEKRHLIAGVSARARNRMNARRTESMAESLRQNGGAGKFLSVQNHFLGSYPQDGAPGALAASLVHSIGRRGTFEEPTGSSSLTSLLATRFQEFGGKIEYGVTIKNITILPRSGVEIILDGDEKRKAKCLVTTSGIAEGLKAISGIFNKEKVSPSNPLVPVRFYLGIKDSLVPVGMEDNLLYMPQRDDVLPGKGGYYLALSPKGSEMAPEGMRAMTVTILTEPSKLSEIAQAPGSDLKRELINALEAVIPFINKGLKYVGSDMSDSEKGMVPRPLGGGTVAWSPGLVGKTNVQFLSRKRIGIISPTPWELGIEGEVISALTAAVALRKLVGSK